MPAPDGTIHDPIPQGDQFVADPSGNADVSPYVEGADREFLTTKLTYGVRIDCIVATLHFDLHPALQASHMDVLLSSGAVTRGHEWIFYVARTVRAMVSVAVGR
jgi:hypothetical protein